MNQPESTPTVSIPRKVNVSLQIGGIFFALANIVCVAILAYAWLDVKLAPKTLEVTGSAKKAIVSDHIQWSAEVSARNKDLTAAYDTLKTGADKTVAFLKEHGIPDRDITLSAITTEKHFKKVFGPAPQNAEITTNEIELYELTEAVTVDSTDMGHVPEVARSVTALIKDGVEIDSGSVQYLYSKLSELKIDMLAEATRDATARATQISTNANGTLGKLVEAHMGVMQINPKGSTATSAEGNNDTTSFEKEITAVVTARFELR